MMKDLTGDYDSPFPNGIFLHLHNLSDCMLHGCILNYEFCMNFAQLVAGQPS